MGSKHKIGISIVMGSLLLYGSLFSSSTHANCHKIRFSDIGWTDITASTALAAEILSSLGYEVKTSMLSVPVTYRGLKNKDLDIFLGNWMPTMAADLSPYQKDGSVETIGTLLKEARYTLAVPKYVSDAGVRSIADLERHREKFQNKIYGIEPGNDGNRLIQKLITDNAYGLGKWKLIESSEQAMLSEVIRQAKSQKWVVYLGWEPHPMNQKIPMTYLSGGDAYFGPQFGKSSVHINSRRGYSQECPQIASFFKNISLTLETENQLMSMILDQKQDPKTAAKKWIQTHLIQIEPWLKGVQSADGRNAWEVIQKKYD
jgi:glycine betaine/proline transport system substrate-binding protein